MFRIRRPERLRAAARAVPAQTTEHQEAADQRAGAVRQTVQSQGWQYIQQHMNAKCVLLWEEFRNPRVSEERVRAIRLELIKYSGIQDVIDDLVNQGVSYDRPEQRLRSGEPEAGTRAEFPD